MGVSLHLPETARCTDVAHSGFNTLLETRGYLAQAMLMIDK